MMLPLIGTWLTVTVAAAAAPDRPSILFIYTDDQAAWTLGVSGNRDAWTPNLDRLAGEGARLVNFFAATPVCSPARVNVLAARHGTEVGITDWINPQTEPDVGLPPEVITWPEVLAAGEYATGLFGKWHLGTAERYHPTRQGFGEFAGFLEGSAKVQDPVLEVGGRKERLSGLIVDRVTDLAIGFMHRHRDRPFAACVHYREPHRPWVPVPEPIRARFELLDPLIPNPDYPGLDVERLRPLMREYLASVSAVDASVGRLLDALREPGLADRTIVIFTSDQGCNMGHNGIWHKGNGHWILRHLRDVPGGDIRLQRPNMYDHSLRVPALVRWPGVTRPGAVIERTAVNLDWYRTLVAAAGLEVPAGATVRGRDLAPILAGREVAWDDDMFGQYSRHHDTTADLRMYRTRPWKLIRDFRNAGRDELYDLEHDPGEARNLIDSPDPAHRAVVEHLHARLLTCMREIDDPVLPAAATRTAASDDAERPPAELRLPAWPGAEQEALGERVYRALQGQARHMLGRLRPWDQDSSMSLLTESRSGENCVRPNACTLAGLCFLHRFGPYESHEVGRTREELLNEAILPMMRYLVATHATGTRPTGDGKPWGDAWQSAYWAAALARAAWWSWPALPAELREGVRRVIAHEADRFVRAVPPFQIEHDTKAEENAWNSQAPCLASILMPEDARRSDWEATHRRWAMSAFLRRADAKSATVIDGRPVSEWFEGANIYDDFTLENHHIVHPDYMTAFSLNLACALDLSLAGRTPPEALRYNLGGLYENLKWFCLPDGGFVYPGGQDWGLFRNPDWVWPHTLMGVFAGDREAWPLMRRCLDVLEQMQRRSPDGAIFLPEEHTFASAQSDKVQQLAAAWLALHFAEVCDGPEPLRRGVRRLDAGRIILHRTPAAVHTVSWGARIMAQCVPYRPDRLVSPHDRNGVGYVLPAGADKPLEPVLRSARVESRPDGFTAELKVDHGDAVRAVLRFVSHADGRWETRERLIALRDVSTDQIATGLIGVLNNPRWIFEKGRRQVVFDGRAQTVAAGSGDTVDGTGCREIGIDGVLRITSAGPLSAHYRGASQVRRGRWTDELYLNFPPGRREWKAGQTISDTAAVVRCAVAASEPATEPADER